MKSLFILGRQPALGLAELESLFGSSKLTPLGGSALVDIEAAQVELGRLGGSLKLAEVIAELPYSDFNKLTSHIRKSLPDLLAPLPDGKIKFGLSCRGIKVSVNDINRASLSLKKAIKAAGHSVRVVPNKDLTLSSAQVLHNQLTSDLGIELLLVAHGSRTILARTIAEQDITAYAARDQARPKRDAKVGMLPPKLAQIILNLAVGNPEVITARTTHPPVVLDPFCGTGVIIQEALLSGYHASGSDLEPRMIEYSQGNIAWLHDTNGYNGFLRTLKVADATKEQWQEMDFVDAIACETYLGRPFSSPPDPAVLQEVMQDVNLIHKRFLQNVARQTPAGFKLCVAVPAWRIGHSFKHLKVLDNLEELGYNRIEFVHTRSEDLIYHREGQIVGRELVVLVRK